MDLSVELELLGVYEGGVGVDKTRVTGLCPWSLARPYLVRDEVSLVGYVYDLTHGARREEVDCGCLETPL